MVAWVGHLVVVLVTSEAVMEASEVVLVVSKVDMVARLWETNMEGTSSVVVWVCHKGALVISPVIVVLQQLSASSWALANSCKFLG